MNLYDTPTGKVQYPDTGDFVEQWPGDDLGKMQVRHILPNGENERDCVCHSHTRINEFFRALAFNETSGHIEGGDWPERENVEPYDFGFGGLGFSSIGSRALMANQVIRERRFGNAYGYVRHDACKGMACNCPINLIELANSVDWS